VADESHGTEYNKEEVYVFSQFGIPFSPEFLNEQTMIVPKNNALAQVQTYLALRRGKFIYIDKEPMKYSPYLQNTIKNMVRLRLGVYNILKRIVLNNNFDNDMHVRDIYIPKKRLDIYKYFNIDTLKDNHYSYVATLFKQTELNKIELHYSEEKDELVIRIYKLRIKEDVLLKKYLESEVQ